MFPSRILPPPVAFSETAGTHPRPIKLDELAEHSRIMTVDEEKQGSSLHINHRSQRHSVSSADKRSPITDSRPSTRGEDKSLQGPGGRSSRKRSLSNASQEVDRPQQPHSRLTSISATVSLPPPIDSPSQICLCQPDPKVPRPRNAFILYRQHHQAQVVSENPGLANPEISKIIGDHWRNSPADVKEHWKKLAEEEKLRHQRQYPDYRYQPKRGRNSVATTTNVNGSPRCIKCGGKSMATPTMPGASFQQVPITATPTTAYPSQMMPPSTPHGIPQTARHPNGMMYAMSPLPQSASFGYRQVAYGVRGTETSPDLPMSPDAKRRRIEARHEHSTGRASYAVVQTTPAGERGPLPRPDFMQQHPGFRMAPAPRPPVAGQRQNSLTLAPLNIKSTAEPSSQAKSVEAMVNSIRPLAKIETIGKVSFPLKKPGPTSPPRPVRGAVIAFEGSDEEALERIMQHIRADLSKYEEHKVRTWASPQLEIFDEGKVAQLGDILQLMTHWHGISSEVIKYITREPEDGAISPISPKTVHIQTADYRISPSKSGEGIQEGDAAAARGTKRTAAAAGLDRRPAIPVAFLPNYQVTTTDRLASEIPIADAYSPMDHWRWVAALWRGTVGPDVIVSVRGPADGPQSPRDQARPPVDVRLSDARTVFVRCERAGEVSDAVLRRVTFEVGDWLRGMKEREDRA